MQKALNVRFKFAIDPLATNFDGIYIASTFLTPAYRGLLDASQSSKAKEFLTEMMTDGSHLLNDCNTSEENADPKNDEEEPPFKRFKHLDRVSELLRKKEEEERNKDSMELTTEEEEIERYTKTKHNCEELKLDPLTYWIQVAHIYPHLSGVACDILTTPASSAPVEHVFSISGEATRGRRNRLVDYNLERETLLRKNKSYL